MEPISKEGREGMSDMEKYGGKGHASRERKRGRGGEEVSMTWSTNTIESAFSL
jgi:hypothetical protein